ncbi:hypothetical protein [Alkalimarinus sediminis]|uniref:AraC family transcriptional regulator n=1 Tax=Alkalimarinus sediminis TaxID=1632866 RepID=A0A9E8HUK3_9ALTE|nr:hypothetical protein [Alkalimarinus sediminis]UZW76004.1 hypothetical protein NNL22_05325 [Alkalimarinus sediminis]
MKLLFEQQQKHLRKLNNILYVLKLWVLAVVVGSSTVNAAEQSIQAKAQKLKSEVVELNRALFELEEELLYPADTQVALFLSVKTTNKFILDSVEIKIDGKIATTYLYTESEIKALEKGGIQRLYMGNISSGPHKLTAVFNGQGANDHYFRKEKTFNFEKSNRSKFIEIGLSDSKGAEPEFQFTEWH